MFRKTLFFSLFLPLIILACDEANNPASVKKNNKSEITSISFKSLPLPRTIEEKKSLRLTESATLNYQDGSSKTFQLSFKTIFKPGDEINGIKIGTLTDKDNQPLLDENNQAIVSNKTDGATVIKKADKFYLFSHFENNAPGAVYLTELGKRDNTHFRPLKTTNVDFSSVNGTMTNCASAKTPWNSHLGSEEDYNFDAVSFSPGTEKYAENISKCLQDPETGKISIKNKSRLCQQVRGLKERYLNDHQGKVFSPYDYGYIFELVLAEDGKPSLAGNLKHYAMGKGTPEMAMVMPDEKTVYITDDGSFRGLYLFVADREKDLSSGTLYMARWEQISADHDGRAELKWVRLGQSNNAKIKQIIARKPLFSDIFELKETKQCQGEGFRLVKAADATEMCIRLRDGQNGSTISQRVFANRDEVLTAAAFLETRRYGTYLGGTAEFRKEEGITYDPDKNVIYLAMSEINQSMLDNASEPQNHIRLKQNDCGVVYQLQLGNSQDFFGQKINSIYSAKEIYALVSGKQLQPGENYSDEHYCHPEAIANPDNIQYIGKNILLIGEDTSFHHNGSVMAYDTQKKTLTRILTSPAGGEITGMFTNIQSENNFYIFSNIQHPLEKNNIPLNAFGEKVGKEIFEKATDEERRSIVGYIDGLPSF